MPLQRLWGEFEATVSGECETYCRGTSIAPRLNCTMVCDELEKIVSAHVLSPQELSGGQVTCPSAARTCRMLYLPFVTRTLILPFVPLTLTR